MYGDLGHGGLLFLFAIYVCLKGEELRDKPNWQIFYKIRYLLLMMGFFATYMGAIYNEFMSLSLNIFGSSCYEGGDEADPGCVYPFGIDSAWEGNLGFLNSFKMKAAVVVGVSHMLLGISLKGANHLNFGQTREFVNEFVPQMLMLVCMFGYMDYLIFQKWMINWREEEAKAPSIINTMIEMFLNGGEITSPDTTLPILDNQTTISKVMLSIVVVCPPWILFVKPYLVYTHNQ